MAKKKVPIPTLAEIKAKVKNDQTNRWHHSDPLFALYATQEGIQFLPLGPEAENEILLLFLFDIPDFSLEITLEELSAWKNRYKKLPWTGIIAFQQKYNFVKNSNFFDRFRAFPAFTSLPILMDPFGEVFEKFGSSQEAVVALFQKGSLVYSTSLATDIEKKISDLEIKLQECLRRYNHGLPLPLVYSFKTKRDFDLKALYAKDFIREGNWIENTGSLATEDSNATLAATLHGQKVRCMIGLHAEARENSRVILTFNNEPISKAHKSEEIRYDDKNNSFIEIDRLTGFYEIFDASEPIKGTLKFQFVSAVENPIIFYEIRVGGRLQDSA